MNNDFQKDFSYGYIAVDKRDDLCWIKCLIYFLYVEDKISAKEYENLIRSLKEGKND